eukprot:1391736-Pleurochrysis_carterae.AAC.1
MAAGDAQSLAKADPRYVLIMDQLRDVLSTNLPDFGSSPAEGHRVEQIDERGQGTHATPGTSSIRVDEPEGHDAPTGENHSIRVTFVEGAELQPLFAQPLSGCMKAVIPLRVSLANAGNGVDVSVTAVVDSGAAHTAVT